MLKSITCTALLLSSLAPAQLAARPYSTFTNSYTGGRMQMPIDSLSSGQYAEQVVSSGSSGVHQQWDEEPILGTAAFRLVHRRSGLVLTTSATASRRYVWQTTPANSALQMWFRETDTNLAGWRLKNAGTGMYLQPLEAGFRTWKDLVVQPRANSHLQMWSRSTVTAYSSYVIQNRRSGLVLDIPYAAFTNVYGVQQYLPHSFNVVNFDLTTNKNPAQQFQIRSIGSGRYLILSRATGWALDVPGFTTAENTRIQQFPLNSGINQQWRIEYADNGHVYIVSQNSGKFLAMENGSTQPGARLVQRSMNQLPTHSYHWKLVRRR